MSDPAKYAVLKSSGNYAIGEWTIDESSEVGYYLIVCEGIDDPITASNMAEAFTKARPEPGNYL